MESKEFYRKIDEYIKAIKKEDIEYRLLKDALIYTDYIGYERYVSEITKNHPKLYIDIFNHLEKKIR